MTDPASPTGNWFHPSRRPYRFVVLFFAAFMMYGSYFAYDAVGAIENSLMSTLGIGQERIGDLYSVYSLGPLLFLFLAGFTGLTSILNPKVLNIFEIVSICGVDFELNILYRCSLFTFAFSEKSLIEPVASTNLLIARASASMFKSSKYASNAAFKYSTAKSGSFLSLSVI